MVDDEPGKLRRRLGLDEQRISYIREFDGENAHVLHAHHQWELELMSSC